MVRVVFGGAAFDGFAPGEFTDHYVKLKLPDPQDPETVRTRTYSVRAWDAEAQQLTIDFVVHGDVGVAGPWARRAQPGDELDLVGPGGAYTPDPDADWHLLAGDGPSSPRSRRRSRASPGHARARGHRGRRAGGGAGARHPRRPRA